jgi:plastocyanin
MRTPLHRVLCVAAVAALPLAACSSGDDDEGGTDSTEAPSGDVIAITAADSLRFDPDAIEAPAGAIALQLENTGSIQHTLVIEDHESDLKLNTPSRGSTDDGTITLEEGEYTYYCDVAGHRGGGMEGTLTVGPAAP